MLVHWGEGRGEIYQSTIGLGYEVDWEIYPSEPIYTIASAREFCENESQKDATFTRNHGVLTTWMEYLDSDLVIYAIVGPRNAF